MGRNFKIGAGLSLDGEKEFKKAVNEINRDISVLASEMGKVTAQFEDNGRSVKDLTAKQNVLERQLLNQAEKVDTLRKALEKSANEYGEADRRTKYWQISLNKAEAELSKTQKELNRTNKELNEFGKEAKDAVKQSSLLGDIFKGGFFANIATGALSSIVNGVQEFTSAALDLSDELMKMSGVTGRSVEELQQLKYVGDDLGISLDTMTTAQSKFTRSMSEAQQGADKQIAAFSALGVEYLNTDGSLRSATDVMYEAFDALGNVGNEAERDALAMQVFGRSAMELNPLIKAGSDELKRLSDEASNTGAVMSQDAVEALDAFGDMLDHLKQQAIAFAGEALGGLISSGENVAEINDKLAKNEQISTLIDRYYELKNRLDDTSLSSDELRTVSEELVKVKLLLIDLSDGMISAYGEESGAIDGQIAQYNKLTDAEKELLRQQLLLSAKEYGDNLKREADLKIEITAASEKLASANKDLVDSELQYNKMKEEGASAYELATQLKLIESYRNIVEGVGGAQDAYESLNKELENLRETSTEATAAIKGLFDIGMSTREIADTLGVPLGDVYNILNDMQQAAQTAGKQTMQGYIQGILGEKDNVVNAFKEVADAALNKGVKEPWDINSPSKVMEDATKNIWAGMLGQTERMSGEINRAFESTAKQATQAVANTAPQVAQAQGAASSAQGGGTGRIALSIDLTAVTNLDNRQIAVAQRPVLIELDSLAGTSLVDGSVV